MEESFKKFIEERRRIYTDFLNKIKLNVEYKSKGKLYYIVLRDPSSGGKKYRIQTFDEYGFWGHSVYDTFEDAIKDLFSEVGSGDLTPCPGILDKLATSDKWKEGLDIMYPGIKKHRNPIRRIPKRRSLKRLELGNLYMTRGINSLIERYGDVFYNWILVCIKRHVSCDWGDMCEEDKEQNDLAMKEDERILSVYKNSGIKIYIITEWDRSSTTVLLPEEY